MGSLTSYGEINMALEKLKKRKLELEEIISTADKHYAETGEDYIPDDEYHKLREELKTIFPESEVLNKLESIQVSSSGKVKHDIPMLSLDKVYSVEDLKKWMQKVSRTKDEKFLLSIKFDGIAARLDSRTNPPILSTRGNGYEGENISSKLKYIVNAAPTSGRFFNEVENGELIIPTEVFETKVRNKLKRSNGDFFKNPRNAVAGMMNFDGEIESNIVMFVPYWFRNISTTIETIDSGIFALSLVLDQFPNDGYVLKLEDEEYGNSLGHTSHHWKHSIALKHTNQSTVTRLIGVEFNVAREYIGMTALLEPVDIDGSTISRASLHTFDIIKKLDIKIGDYVTLEKAGGVIPYIKEVLKDRRDDGEDRIDIALDKCPSCSGEIEKADHYYICKNDSCEDKIVNNIEYGLKIFGCKGIATETIRRIYNKDNKINHISKFLDSTLVTKNLLLSIDGIKEASANNILSSLQAIKDNPPPIENAFASLGIFGVGRTAFRKIFTKIIPELLLFASEHGTNQPMKLTLTNIINSENINGIGPETVDAISTYFSTHGNPAIAREILGHLNLDPKTDTTKKVNKTMKSVCFTGKAPSEYTRSKLENIAVENGYEPKSGVSKDLTVLVTNDLNGSSSKMKSAKKHNVSCMTYEDFFKTININ